MTHCIQRHIGSWTARETSFITLCPFPKGVFVFLCISGAYDLLSHPLGELSEAGGWRIVYEVVRLADVLAYGSGSFWSWGKSIRKQKSRRRMAAKWSLSFALSLSDRRLFHGFWFLFAIHRFACDVFFFSLVFVCFTSEDLDV